MRRRLLILVGIALLACGVMLVALRVDKAPKGRGKVRGTLPTMAALREPDEGARTVPAEDGMARVVCRVEGVPGQIIATSGEGSSSLAVVSGNELILTLEPGTWRLVWTASGSDASVGDLGSYELDPGEVRTCQLSAHGVTLRGRVVDLRGRALAGAEVEACGGEARSGEDGTFETVMRFRRLRDGHCAVRALWTDGALSRWGDAVDVDVLSANVAVELTVDNGPVAGLGVSFRVGEDGVDVTEVMEGSPADKAGIEPGMLILSVDGVVTAGMTPEDFLAIGLGREGSTVRLTVDDGDAIGTFEFRRERIEGEG